MPTVNPLDEQERSCIMDLYSVFIGDWQGRKRGYRWQKLNGGHSALSDCRAAWNRIMEMKHAEIVTTDEAFRRFSDERVEQEQFRCMQVIIDDYDLRC